MKFRFSGPLLRFVNYRKEIEVHADTLGVAFEQLALQCPLLAPVIRDRQGNVLSAHRMVIAGEFVKNPDPSMGLKPNDCVEILTSVAGG